MSAEEPAADTSAKSAVDTSTGESWEDEADAIVAQRQERERLEREALAAEDEARQASAALKKAAAANAIRVRANDTRRADAEFTSLLDGILKRAEQQTGMTREQMLATPDTGDTPSPVNEPATPRQVAANRGVPEKHLRAVVDKPPLECQALSAVRAFLSSERTFLVLSSTVGRYKSGSACWALTQKSGLYLKAADLSALSTARDPEGMNTWRAAKRVGLLVLDDLDGDYFDDKGYLYRALNTLVDVRYENVLKTLITTNLDAEGFRRHAKARIVDRIREDGVLAWEPLEGESVRSREPGEDDE